MGAVEFARLFLGNQRAYGGDEGKAIRCTANEWFKAVAAHYNETGPAVGVYPLIHDERDGWVVRWGCVDFDIKSEGHEKYDYETEEEAHTAAVNLMNVLKAFSITAWIETTKSKGRHVWVFANQRVPAKLMREALLVATEIAGVSQREVNPKSDGSNLDPDQLGNYVRLPCHGARMIYGWADTDTFVANAMQWLTTAEDLAKPASLYREPVPVVNMVDEGSESWGKAPRVVQHVILNGPNDGDRSKGLLYIAHECRKAGLPPKQALELVMVADEAWQKYTGRRDREQRLHEIIERAWR